MVKLQEVPCPKRGSLKRSIQEPFRQTFRENMGPTIFPGENAGSKKNDKKKCRERLVGMEFTYIFKATGPRLELKLTASLHKKNRQV